MGTVRVTAELALTFGLVLLLFAFYLLVWSNQRTAMAQDDLMAEFRTAEGSGKEQKSHQRPDRGDGVAVLHIPRLGKEWAWVVVEGTDDADLRKGPGRFSDSAMPGQIGNFAVAGHRATHGEPFAEVDQLAEGDRMVVETGTEWLVYEVIWERIVAPTSVEVIAPVAGHPGRTPTQSMMTLVTCHPRWASTERLIISSQLVERRDAGAGPPDDLA